MVLRFNPRGKGGEFLETGTVIYGPHRKRIHLSMTGNCITSEETLLRQFPIRISDHLRLSANRFDLGIMRLGETKERNVVMLHKDEANRQELIPISFTVDQQTKKGLQHIVRKIHTLQGGKKTTIDITFDVLIK